MDADHNDQQHCGGLHCSLPVSGVLFLQCHSISQLPLARGSNSHHAQPLLYAGRRSLADDIGSIEPGRVSCGGSLSLGRRRLKLMIAPLAKFIDWSALQMAYAVVFGLKHAPKPQWKLDEALE